MKNIPLYKLKTKKSTYYKRLGAVIPFGKRKTTIEYIVKRTYDALPKKYKEYLEEDKTQLIKVLTNIIIQQGSDGSVNPYMALVENAKSRQRRSGAGTKQFIYRRFRLEYPQLYNTYNSYMYRMGLSASQYFMQNVDIAQQESLVTALVNLPRERYNTLYIEYNFSGQEITAFLE